MRFFAHTEVVHRTLPSHSRSRSMVLSFWRGARLKIMPSNNASLHKHTGIQDNDKAVLITFYRPIVEQTSQDTRLRTRHKGTSTTHTHFVHQTKRKRRRSHTIIVPSGPGKGLGIQSDSTRKAHKYTHAHTQTEERCTPRIPPHH